MTFTHILSYRQKSPSTTAGYSGYDYELSNHLNTLFNSLTSDCAMQSGVFALFKNFFKNCSFHLAVFEFFGEWGTKGEITNHPLSRLRKEVRI